MKSKARYLLMYAIVALLGYSNVGIAQETLGQELKRLVEQAGNSYIFILRGDYPAPQVEKFAARIAQKNAAQIRHVFTSAIKGFSLTVPEWQARNIAKAYRDILYVEDNTIVWLAAIQPESNRHTGIEYAAPIGKALPAETVHAIQLKGNTGADACDTILASIDRAAQLTQNQRAKAMLSSFEGTQPSKALFQALQHTATQGMRFIFNAGDMAVQVDQSAAHSAQEIDINALFIGGGKGPFTTVSSQ